MRTRSDMFRKRRNKKNIMMNSLIVVIFALILIVGANILFGGDDTAEGGKNSKADGDGEKNQEEMKITDDDENKDQPSDSANSGDAEDGNQSKDDSAGENEDAADQLIVEEGDESGNDEKNNDSKEKQSDDESDQDKDKPNEDQIGKPIGTSQTGEHRSSYEKGSVDWNEKIKAVKLATGVDDGMTVWRMENGGGPQKAAAKVSPEGVQDWMYVVNLQWVDQKGWKVTSVKKQQR